MPYCIIQNLLILMVFLPVSNKTLHGSANIADAEYTPKLTGANAAKVLCTWTLYLVQVEI